MVSAHGSYPSEAGPEGSPAEPDRERARLDSLTGLRFFAAFVVFALHFAVIFSGGSPTLLRQEHLYHQGAVGVSFFFILSGFVLTWSHRAGDRPLRFMRRRLARIIPLHLVTTAAAAVIVIVVGAWPGKIQALRSVLLLPTWVPDWSEHKVLDSPSWSLGCELFFYALFPLLFWGLRRCPVPLRRGLMLACAATPIALAAALEPRSTLAVSYWLIYYCPPVRLLEFVLGMILALEVAEGRVPRLPLLPIVVVNVAVYLADGWASLGLSPVAVTLVPFAFLVVAAAQSDVHLRPSLLRRRPLVLLGVWSFAFYLAHFPLMTALAYAVKGTLDGTATVVTLIVSFFGTLVAAGVLHTWVERPLELVLRGRPPAAPARPRAPLAEGQVG